jgi:hypothetical protein
MPDFLRIDAHARTIVTNKSLKRIIIITHHFLHFAFFSRQEIHYVAFVVSMVMEIFNDYFHALEPSKFDLFEPQKVTRLT